MHLVCQMDNIGTNIWTVWWREILQNICALDYTAQLVEEEASAYFQGGWVLSCSVVRWKSNISTTYVHLLGGSLLFGN